MFQKTLSRLKEQGRYRSLQLPNGVDLTSNDYLGMASHPALRACATQALEGGLDIGSGGSRLLRGHTPEHENLEVFAAAYFGAPASLFFANGFIANYALLTTLPARGDVIVYDSLVHASMRDGLKACDAKSYKFAHMDLGALEDSLKRHRDKADTLWIAVESVYSMDGDCAPLSEIYDLAVRYDAMLMIDEAHASGALGEKGRGLAWDIVQAHGYDRIVTLHTCGKAIGVAGGLVCASRSVVDYLVNKARPFIYSTAPLPLQSVLVKKSLEILASDEGNQRRSQLFAISEKAQAMFGGVGTHIVPLMIGDDKRAVQVAGALQEVGYDIRAIRPPTVPNGTARLRLSLSSQIALKDLESFYQCYKDILD